MRKAVFLSILGVFRALSAPADDATKARVARYFTQWYSVCPGTKVTVTAMPGVVIPGLRRLPGGAGLRAQEPNESDITLVDKAGKEIFVGQVLHDDTRRDRPFVAATDLPVFRGALQDMFGLPVNLAVAAGPARLARAPGRAHPRGAERGRLGRRLRVAGRRVDPGRASSSRSTSNRTSRARSCWPLPGRRPGEEVGLLRHGFHRLPVRAVPRPDAAGAHVRVGARRRGAGALPAARQDPQLGVRGGRVRGGAGRRLAAAVPEVRRRDLSARRRHERDVGPRRGGRRRAGGRRRRRVRRGALERTRAQARPRRHRARPCASGSTARPSSSIAERG